MNKVLQVVSPRTFTLRNKPIELSEADVIDLIRKYNFWDNTRNPDGKNFFHQYKEKKIKDDKIIFDELTCLVWQQSGSSEWMTYENSKMWIKELNQKGFAGSNDWRLPTLEEAMSLMDRRKNDSDLNIEFVFDRKQWWIWKSDLVKGGSRAWVVDFKHGNCHHGYSTKRYVRAVRSGQLFQE